MSFTWPKEVKIPDRVGKGMYTNVYGEACCAAGLAGQALGHPPGTWGWLTREQENDPVWTRFLRTYKGVYAQLHDESPFNLGYPADWKNLDVEGINDIQTPNARLMLYCITWAVLGYTEGQTREVRKWARELNEGITRKSGSISSTKGRKLSGKKSSATTQAKKKLVKKPGK